MKYPMIQIGKVATLIRDSILPGSIENNTTYIGLEHINVNGITTPQKVKKGDLNSNKFCFKSTDVLYGKLRPYLKKIACPDYSGICSTDIIPLRPNKSLDKKYLFYFLRQQKMIDLAVSKCTGANLPRLSPNELLTFEIPLPPLEEQKRIAAILDKANELKEKRKKAIEKLDELVQAVFIDMFGDPIKNDKKWPLDLLKYHTSKVGSGATPTGGNDSYKKEGIALIRSLNVRDGNFQWKDLARIDNVQAGKLSNVIVQENDVLLNITGASVARVCRVPKEVIPARVNQHVCIIRPTINLDATYLEKMLLVPSMKNKLLSISASGATREAITKEQILNFTIPLPPIESQIKYSNFCKTISQQKEAHINQLSKINNLFLSLQTEAFGNKI